MLEADEELRFAGPYVLFGAIASGGMGTVHFGRLLRARNFSTTVAIKRLATGLANDPRFVSMLVDEARLVSRIRHPNVVATLDIVEDQAEALVVMEYVHGLALSELLRVGDGEKQTPPLGVLSRIVCDVLQGLHAAHEARSELGTPLGLVHRDVSPHNILVGADGIARVADFGVAKAFGYGQATAAGELKGKLRYVAPEQVLGTAVDRRADLYSMAVVLWEAVTGEAFRPKGDMARTAAMALLAEFEPPSKYVSLPSELEEVILRALSPEPAKRFAFATTMSEALAAAAPPASPVEVCEWMRDVGGLALARRDERLLAVESRVVSRPDEVAEVPVPSTPSARMPNSESDTVSAMLPISLRGAAALEARPPSSRRTKFWVASTLLVLLAVSGTIAIFQWPSGARRDSGSEAGAQPSGTEPNHAAAAPLPMRSAEPMNQPSDTQVAAPIAQPSAAPSVPPRTSASARSAATGPRSPGAVPVDCSLPYTVDREGIRVPRPECLRLRR